MGNKEGSKDISEGNRDGRMSAVGLDRWEGCYGSAIAGRGMVEGRLRVEWECE
ncbi:hypothetical protein SERLA73DRAFT_187694 [Serpula lacrymans var. lacrymans S7.3]|uniref:Uncharacterized protein n=2 Tax=Serpula lacrymans var. lacrymans TaxID=341189 RepID=F8QA64_SERL3|nr:uncharacterized protein SERLADRAFT_477453 [Serpula lacrymans var. lacrymans S7.9]EGN94654.1 hypothetical protein SERLA73DRAFT_187694 [Serpula lacrymans var. lacrymans S7.3]EGO20135.1 hypothetical protein SERLADRAFT_477453 [Serpula lacrymans var. lacrymans S7.9]